MFLGDAGRKCSNPYIRCYVVGREQDLHKVISNMLYEKILMLLLKSMMILFSVTNVSKIMENKTESVVQDDYKSLKSEIISIGIKRTN